MKRKTNFFVSLGLFVACFLFSSQMNTGNVSAYSASITTNDSIVLNATPNGDGTSIQAETINVTSDCRAGYNLTIATPQGSNLYKYENDVQSSTTASFTAVDGTSSLNSANNTNKWGYTVTSDPTSSAIFSPLSTTESTLKTPSQTISIDADIDDTFDINYGIKTDSTITPGNYRMANNGAIVYYLTMSEVCTKIDIVYDGNNADAGTMAAVHKNIREGDEISLVASNFSRMGYGFAGWSTDSDAGAKLIDNDNTNNPIVYGPQEDIIVSMDFIENDTDFDGIVKLYAVWVPSQGNLQGWTGCDDLDTATYDSVTGKLDFTKDSVTALTDMRDNDTYAVARLADGQCWMIENLRLDAGATIGNNQDDPTFTNEFLSQGYGKSYNYGNFSGLADSESANFSNSSAANSLYYSGTQSGNAVVNVGTADYPAFRIPRYNNLNTANRATNPTGNTFANNNTGGMYSYGNYYNWHAAVADLTYNNTNNASVANTSLCPSGWRLPSGGNKTNIELGNQDYWNLSVNALNNGIVPSNYNSSIQPAYSGAAESESLDGKLRAYPNNLLYAGLFGSEAAAQNRGSRGYYWTSTLYDYKESYRLRLFNTAISPGTYDDANTNGCSIRCVAVSPETYTLSYNANGGTGAPAFQTMTANGLAEFTVSDTIPTRTGYTFMGWIDEDGNTVQAGGTIRIKNANTTVYAKWANDNCNSTASTIGAGDSSTDAVCLQDVKPGMKSALSVADTTTGTYTLIDARDGQSYTVAKLADGELWMTKDLNLGREMGGENSDGTFALTPDDTDLTGDTAFVLPASTTNYTTGAVGYYTPQILINYTVPSYTISGTTYTPTVGYYSWPAATATKMPISASAEIKTSICPKGWDLPNRTQLYSLRSKGSVTSTATAHNAPYNFVYGGYRNGNDSYSNQTSTGYYWTSSNSSASNGYWTFVNSGGINNSATSSAYKYYGAKVRCVASQGTVTVNYDGNGTTEYPTTGTVASQIDVEINSTNARANSFTRTEWAFNGWNTASDGSGIAVAAGGSLAVLGLSPNTIITLYAQWVPQYTITYVDNCKTWAASDANCTDVKTATTSAQKINLDTSGNGSGTLGAWNKFTMTGWKIKEWTTNADGTGTAYPVANTYTVPSGSGVGSGITLYAHWVPVYTVQYDGNGSDNDSTGMGSTNESTGIKTVNHYNVAEGDTFDLFASNFKKAGYGFVGWSLDANAWNKLIDDDATNDVRIWGPNEIFTAPAPNGTPIITLYAIWVPAERTDPDDSSSIPVYLQNWTGCSTMTATTYDATTGKLSVAKNTITALTDQRDGNIYTIARLADENCWMIESLRLDNTVELSTTNTNIKSDNSTLPITNIYNADSALATKSNFLSPSSSQNITNDPNYGWCKTNSAACINQSRLNSTNTTSNTTPSKTHNVTSPNAHIGLDTFIYSYGNYYNWYSVTAGYGLSSTSSATPTEGDICPTGWHLPYGGSSNKASGGFYYLSSVMDVVGSNRTSSNKYRSFPNNFLYTGRWEDSSLYYHGGTGYYASSSASSNERNYYLYFTMDRLEHGTMYKYNGITARCVINS